jgi:uncharacterized Zn-finger protein
MREEKIAFVICPGCGTRFHLLTEDFAARPQAHCHCPNCHREFQPREHLELRRL